MAQHIIKIIDISDEKIIYSFTFARSQRTDIGRSEKSCFSDNIEIGDVLLHIEHGFCDHYCNNIQIGGLHLSISKIIKSIKNK